jgi:hypothetical protein
MVRVVKLYAISNQPYAKYARLTFRIFLNSLQALFIAQVLFHSLVHAAAPLNKILVLRARRANEKEHCTSRKIKAISASMVSISPWCRFAMARSACRR